jgi:hypothetical protein
LKLKFACRCRVAAERRNQQKIVIGRWLATRPRCCCDDPTKGIDIRPGRPVRDADELCAQECRSCCTLWMTRNCWRPTACWVQWRAHSGGIERRTAHAPEPVSRRLLDRPFRCKPLTRPSRPPRGACLPTAIRT